MVKEVTWVKLSRVRGVLALLVTCSFGFSDRVTWGQSGEALELPEIVNLVFTNSPYAFFKGVELPSEPLDAWLKPGFDDSGWFQELYTPFSYGESLGFGTILEDMQDNYTTFLLRHSFDIQDPEKITGLVVNAAIDDGFIAWINGREILRVNVADRPFGIGYTASTVPEPVPYVRYDVDIDDELLLFGENVLGVQVVNGNIASSDIFFEISLDGVIGVDQEFPHLPSLDPSKEPIIEGVFDLGSEWRFFRGTTEPADSIDGWRQPEFDDAMWELGPSPLFYGEDVQGGTLIEDMFGNYSTVYLRRSFTAEESQLNRAVEVSALIDDGLAVWINGRELGRAAVDRGDLPFDSDANIGAEEPLQPTLFYGPSDFLSLGENWIAVQALNGNLFSSDFFVDLKLGVVDAPVIPKRAGWLFFPGTTDPNAGLNTNWQEIDYDDSTWSHDEAPFVSVRSARRGTLVPEMLGQFGSVFLRKSFYLDHPSLIDAFELQFQLAHGAAAWVNGTEVFRENLAEADLALDALALRTLNEPTEIEASISVPPGLLRRGENVIAVRAVNSHLNQEDFVFDLSLDVEGLDATTPALVELDPPRGAVSELTEIKLVFSENVFGVGASDLTVNEIPALDVIREGREFTFLIAEPSVWPAIVVLEPVGRILDLAQFPNFFPFTRTEWSYEKEDFDAPKLVRILPVPGAQLEEFGEVELQFDEPITGLASDRVLANGVASSSLVEIEPGRYQVQFESIVASEVVVDLIDKEAILDANGNRFEGLDAWSYDIKVDAPSISINEVVSASYSGLADEDGEYEDWIELYNEGDSAISLSGWSLSDDLDAPRQWLFPDVEIAAREYLVLFASGKDRRDSTISLHTNFKLGRGGDAVYLFRPDLPLVIESQSPDPLPELRDGVSFGRGFKGIWKFFTVPTPGEANGESNLKEVLSPVTFNVSHGLFEMPFRLTLSSKDSGAVIRYTMDGSDPSEGNGDIYTQPLLISESTIVRAAAFRSNALSSMIRSKSFLFPGTSLRGDLPVFSLATGTENVLGPTGILGISGGQYIPRGTELVWSALNPEDFHNPTKRGIQWERPVSIEYFDPSGDGFQMDGGIRVHGSVSARPKLRVDSKFGYRLYFRSDYDSGSVNFPVIEAAGGNSFDRIVLRSGHNDSENPFISDELMRRLSASLGRLTSQGGFSHVFLNGEYSGYYNHTERIEIASLQKWFGGNNKWDIIKPFGALSEGDKDEWDEMIAFFSSADLTLPANFVEAGRHLELPAFVDYLLVNIYGDTGDWVQSNWRAVREEIESGKFRFLVWDAEFSFGIYGRPVDRNTLELPGELGKLVGSGTYIPLIFDQLRQSEEFRLLFADRVQKHFFNDGAMTDEAILSLYETTRKEVDSAILDFQTHIEDTWIPGRRGFMLGHLAEAGLVSVVDAPVLSRAGGAVPAGFGLTIENSSRGDVYYTFDGRDPRVAFENVPSTTAIRYDGESIILTESVELMARAFQDGKWSALSEGRFSVGANDSGITITEIHYHPADSSEPEFVELINRSGTPVDLAGAQFEGIGFEFPDRSLIPPGAIWVLVRDVDREVFLMRHPEVPIAGLYPGKLSNKGELIQLISSFGAFLTGVSYDDSNGWPILADGKGPSLELKDLSADPNDPTQWLISDVNGGTPGVYAQSESADIHLSEVYVAISGEPTDRSFVELLNQSGVRIDLSDWAIVTLKGGVDLFQFASGFGIDPEELLLIELGDAGDTEAGRSMGALLDPKEDTAMLVDADRMLIDSVRYGDQVVGSSLIRGADNLWILGTPSPGLSNQPRELADSNQFVINEWQSNPLAGRDDWFEIYNPDPLNPGALHGLTFSDGESLVTLRSLVFVPPDGFVRLWADDGRGPDHLPFRLASGGGKIEILSGDSSIIDSIEYEAQSEGESMGRVPDGGAEFGRFTDGGSPGRSNVKSVTGDLALSEVLWINQTGVRAPHGSFSSFVEVANVGGSEQDLTGVVLQVESVGLDSWAFPAGTTLISGERLVIWLDRDLPSNDNGNFYFDLVNLPTIAGGQIELVGANGRSLDSIQFGAQVVDVSLGRFGSEWALCQKPSPGEEESLPLELGSAGSLRVNEWLAASEDGTDWIELYNSENQVVSLDGLILTDRPGILGKSDPAIGPYHYIGPRSWMTLGSSRSFPAGAPSTLGFSLAREGEFIRLYDSGGELIDGVDFARQAPGRSEGRIPDGSDRFAASLPSPGFSNVGQETLDSDQDGLPDEWELAHGLNPADSLDAFLDPDLDGVINLDEYFDDTNPHDEIELIIGAINFGAEGLLLQFNVRENRRYRLEYKTGLQDDEWLVEADFTTEEGQAQVEFLDESIWTDIARYYRLIRL